MLPDVLSPVVRAFSFIAALQAAGGALFLALVGDRLVASTQSITRIGSVAAVAGALAFGVHYWLEAARMAGSLSGLFDLSLLAFLFTSNSSVVLAVRLSSLLLVLLALRRRGEFAVTAAVSGATLLAASFALTGHTAASPERWLLAPILILHLLVIAFWFGALLPLYVVSQVETPMVAAKSVGLFSIWATRLVPMIFGAGLLLLWRLLPGVHAFLTPYGLLMLGKICAFALLMGLAALNKWRFSPTMASVPGVHGAFRRTVLAEFVLISIVLAVTAVTTAFFSPAE